MTSFRGDYSYPGGGSTMCGIVGYLGDKEAAPILLSGLRRLEYRGYDSAGIAVANGAPSTVLRRRGKLAELERLVATETPHGNVGIGHTRWATHGRPPTRTLTRTRSAACRWCTTASSKTIST